MELKEYEENAGSCWMNLKKSEDTGNSKRKQ